jgi:hypothetical protein
MVRLTEEQVDYIFEDIKSNGVVLEDLRHNLLDHICCILEDEMTESDNFYKFYKKVLPRFFQKELKEIQEETDNLLMFKNYYAMKNTLKITGLLSSFLTITGATLKTFHLPGAAIAIVLGAALFCLIFLPLMIVLKFKDEEKQVDKWVFSFGFLVAIAISMGVLFKIMHWPYANILMRSGLTAFVFAYVPIYYLTRVRRPELKFNATINSVLMMACGGLLYALYNLGYSSKVNDTLRGNYDFLQNKQSELLIANNELLTKNQNDTTLKIHEQTQKLITLIDETQFNLIALIDNISIEEARNLSVFDIQHHNDVDIVRHHFGNASNKLSYKKLLNELTNYNQLVSLYFPNDKEKFIEIEKLELDNTIISILVQNFIQIKLQLLNNENSILSLKNK